jgi:membrane-associated HD superfamily phosphohydrolase
MSPDQYQQMSPAMGAGAMIVFFVIYIAIYVFFAYALAKLAQKLGHPFNTSLIMALIPIANIILLLQLAAKPLWWIILLLIPLVNIVILVMVWMAIAEKRGKPGWWGVLMLVPIANIIVFCILCFGSSGTVAIAKTA